MKDRANKRERERERVCGNNATLSLWENEIDATQYETAEKEEIGKLANVCDWYELFVDRGCVSLIVYSA